MRLSLRFHVQVAQLDGPFAMVGKQMLREGGNDVLLTLPQGSVASVTAQIPLPLRDGEKIFMNGYQTWTDCPEYDRNSRIRGLHRIPQAVIRQYALDRCGDYPFTNYPYRRGVTHGVSYCYFRHGDRYRLIASLDENHGYTLFRYDAASGVLSLRRDCAGLRCGGAFSAFSLFLAEGTEDQVFDAWFAAMGVRPRTARRLAGYSSWYNRYEQIDQRSILMDMAGCRNLLREGDLFQIDDGWEQAVGDWEPDWNKFPDGIKSLADAAHESGFLAGLWLAPFSVQKDSKLYARHPDWVLQRNGQPYLSGCNWGGFYSLDIDKPEVIAYLEDLFHKVLELWGFDFVKLDFLYGAAPFGSADETRGGRMRRALELLRRLCGEKLILGCGVPLAPAFGIFDYCRVSCDVSLDWDDKTYRKLLHRERVSTRHAIRTSIFRRQLNGRAFGSDPDVFILRDENCQLSARQKEALSTVNALFSGILLTSDDPGNYTPPMRSRYHELLRLRDAEDVKVDADDGLTVSYTLDGERFTLVIPE